MQSGLEALNRMPPEAAEKELLRCCASGRWAKELAGARPFADLESLRSAADQIWRGLSLEDWLEAFAGHPRIGQSADVNKKPEPGWSAKEQSGAAGESREILDQLYAKNREYESKFGFTFIVFATGKSGSEMLEILKKRLENDKETELFNAAQEQAKITLLRLKKLVEAI